MHPYHASLYSFNTRSYLYLHLYITVNTLFATLKIPDSIIYFTICTIKVRSALLHYLSTFSISTVAHIPNPNLVCKPPTTVKVFYKKTFILTYENIKGTNMINIKTKIKTKRC